MISADSDYVTHIKYIINSDTNKQVRTGFSFNINNQWLCLYTSDDRLRTGQELEIQNINRENYQKAVVRWIEKFENYYFVILDYIHERHVDNSRFES